MSRRSSPVALRSVAPHSSPLAKLLLTLLPLSPMERLAFAVLMMACALGSLPAQGVPAQQEPHHHPVFQDAAFRVLRVEVPGHDTTLMHRHDPDYFWIALDATDIVNAKYHEPDVHVVAAASSLHFSKGGFSHVARVNSDRPFRNVTIELFMPQSNPRNLCEAVLEG